MFDLKPEIKQSLIDMDFIKQFEKLSEDYADAIREVIQLEISKVTYSILGRMAISLSIS
ncbi:hypothetical protein ACVR0S_05565 [Streptococcus dentapri]|uniref:Uncharacterized protein n=1 Tax=Streptococcus dentapri TaxID=573564 RepID=A0ABV8D0J7_9STRE